MLNTLGFLSHPSLLAGSITARVLHPALFVNWSIYPVSGDTRPGDPTESATAPESPSGGSRGTAYPEEEAASGISTGKIPWVDAGVLPCIEGAVVDEEVTLFHTWIDLR